MASATASILPADVAQIQGVIAELIVVAAKKSSLETAMFIVRQDARLFPTPMQRELCALVNASPPDETLRAKIEAFVKGRYAIFPLSSAPIVSTPVSLSAPSPAHAIVERVASGSPAPTASTPSPSSPASPSGAAAIGAASPGIASPLRCIRAGGVSAPSAKERLASVLMPLFATCRVALPTTEFCYNANTHDFGIQIQELFFTRPGIQESAKMDGKENKGAAASGHAKKDKKDTIPMLYHFPKNMSALAARLGFNVIYSAHSYPVRDHWLRQKGGKILSFCDTRDEAPITVAIAENLSRGLKLKTHPSAFSKHPFLYGTLGCGRIDHGKALNDLEIYLGTKDLPAFRFYFEGGNHWILTHPVDKGERLLIIGDDTFHVALNHLILTDFFVGIPHFDLAAGIRTQLEKLDPPKIVRTMEAINSQPKIAARLTGTDQIKCATYLAQQEILKTILSMSFEVRPKDLIITPQLNYHLDVFSHPGPKGSMFVQDYGLCVQILEQIKAASETLGLTPTDRAILERYFTMARQLNTELAPLQAATKAAFVRAGITVLPTPGIFFDTAPDGTPGFNVNFLNSISTWSDVTSKHHYIAAGAQVGDRLGSVLMDAFALFLEQYEPNLEVHFIGGDPAVQGIIPKRWRGGTVYVRKQALTALALKERPKPTRAKLLECELISLADAHETSSKNKAVFFLG